MTDLNECCSLCNKPNDQMLMLSCIHDPCINCAASAYAQQVHIKGQSKQVYQCQICGQETLLDSSTITQLLALANNVIKLPSKIQTKNVPPKKKQTQYPSASSVPTSSNKKVVYYCKQHSQQQITYYCFTCWANICPQCAIHGTHKDHQVKLIKKAIAQVKSQYQNLVGKITEQQTSIGKFKQYFLRMIKQNSDRNIRQKNSIIRQFDLLRSALAAKQKQVLRQLEQINKQNIASLTQILQSLSVSHEEANKIKKTVDTINRKDQVLILEDYRGINQLQNNLNDLQKKVEAISTQISLLNSQFLQQSCKEIHDHIIKFKINTKKQELASSK